MLQDDDPMAPLANALAEAVANVSVLMEPIMEAVAGYKARAVAAGMNDAAANQMATDYHGVLMQIVRNHMFTAK